MTKKELIIKILEEVGLNPTEDSDGDIMIRYQMKTIYAIVGDESEQYMEMILPQFYEIEEGEEHVALAVCNKMTRDMKMAKIYVDKSFKNVSANCEFYYIDEESLKNNISQSLNIFGVMRRLFRNAKSEIVD